MTTKDEYIAKMKAQLDEWQVELDELQAKAADAAGDLKEKYQEQIEQLKAKFKEGEAKRDELKDSAEDMWEDLKDEAEEKWAALKEGCRDSIEKIKSMFT